LVALFLRDAPVVERPTARSREICFFAGRLAVFFVAFLATLVRLVLTDLLATLPLFFRLDAFFLPVFAVVFFLAARLIPVFFVVRFFTGLAAFFLATFFADLLAGFLLMAFLGPFLPIRVFLAALTSAVVFPLFPRAVFCRFVLGSRADNSGTPSESIELLACGSSDLGASGGIAGSGIGSHMPGPLIPGPL